MLPLNEYDNRLTQITKHIMSIHSLNVWYFSDDLNGFSWVNWIKNWKIRN